MNDETIQDMSSRLAKIAFDHAMQLYREQVEAVPVDDYWRQRYEDADKRLHEMVASLEVENRRADDLQKRVKACRDIVTTAMPDIESPLDHTVIQLVERLADYCRALYTEMENRTADYAEMQQTPGGMKQ